MCRFESFVFGGIIGALLVWLYGRDLRHHLDEKTRSARTRAAGKLGVAAETLESMKERIEGGFSGSRVTVTAGSHRD